MSQRHLCTPAAGTCSKVFLDHDLKAIPIAFSAPPAASSSFHRAGGGASSASLKSMGGRLVRSRTHHTSCSATAATLSVTPLRTLASSVRTTSSTHLAAQDRSTQNSH